MFPAAITAVMATTDVTGTFGTNISVTGATGRKSAARPIINSAPATRINAADAKYINAGWVTDFYVV